VHARPRAAVEAAAPVAADGLAQRFPVAPSNTHPLRSSSPRVRVDRGADAGKGGGGEFTLERASAPVARPPSAVPAAQAAALSPPSAPAPAKPTAAEFAGP
jgi:hypothetical protein